MFFVLGFFIVFFYIFFFVFYIENIKKTLQFKKRNFNFYVNVNGFVNQLFNTVYLSVYVPYASKRHFVSNRPLRVIQRRFE